VLRKDAYHIYVIRLLILALVIFFALFPFLWMLISSFKPRDELFTEVPSLLIQNPTFENYVWAMGPTGADLPPFFFNTIIITVFAVIMTVIIATLAGYALARFKFPGVFVVTGLFIFSQLFQGPAIMVAWYRMASLFGILNSRLVLVLIYGTSTIPISTFLVAGYVRSVPHELEQAALIDGANRLQLIFYVVFPLLRPFLVAVSTYASILVWNDYQYALVLTSTPAAQTVQIAVANLMESMGAQNWGGIMASGVIVSLPVVIFFAIVQRNLISGLTQGAMKG
jgi:ABC-type glycerol-3-phosphate transport system permease component